MYFFGISYLKLNIDFPRPSIVSLFEKNISVLPVYIYKILGY